MHAQCPICDAAFEIPGATEAAEIIRCHECQNKLEVVCIHKDTNSADLKEGPKVEEDWGQ